MGPLEQRYAQGSFGRFAPKATVDIAAPAGTVWRILTDFGNYHAWNRFTPSVECSGEPGARVVMQVCFPGARPMQQVEVLNVMEPPHRLAWGVIMGARAMLVANRYQVLEALDAGNTRYTTVDYVSGLLAPVVKLLYAEPMRAGFQLAANGLKSFAEAQPGRS
ncbi:MAG: SRPBCC domain-containing protein [Candidatus Binatia bacterium]